MVDHLQKRRPTGGRDPSQRACNHVVDEPRQLIWRNSIGDVWIEDFQEVAELFPLTLLAEVLELVEYIDVQLQLIVERHRVQTEIDAELAFRRLAVEMPALHVIETCRAKRSSGCRVNPAAPMNVNVGRVVRPRRWRDVRVVKQSLLNRQHFAGAGRHQHDVYDPLVDHFANLLAILSQRFEADFAVVPFRRFARSADGKAHVGVFRVRDDEFFAAARIGMNRSQLAVE